MADAKKKKELGWFERVADMLFGSSEDGRANNWKYTSELDKGRKPIFEMTDEELAEASRKMKRQR